MDQAAGRERHVRRFRSVAEKRQIVNLTLEPGASVALVARAPFTWLIAEVPLEDLLAARMKNLVRDRTKTRAWHVQFFTGQSFLRLLTSADGWNALTVCQLPHVRVVQHRFSLSVDRARPNLVIEDVSRVHMINPECSLK